MHRLRRLTVALASAALFTAAVAAQSGGGAGQLPPGVYARMETNRGTIVLNLEYQRTPLTVINFVGLAEGTLQHSRSNSVRYYDGLTFHRVIENFMIQGGDPTGTGSGGPGYSFPDEFDPALRHDRAGILSMANSGPGTNGSQFFITHVATPHLDGAHTIFGEVLGAEDQAVVDAIVQGDRIEKATLTGDADAAISGQEARIEEWNKTLDRR